MGEKKHASCSFPSFFTCTKDISVQCHTALIFSLLHLSSSVAPSSRNALYSLLLKLLTYTRHVAQCVCMSVCVANMKASSNCFSDSDGY